MYDTGMLSYLHGFHAGGEADTLKHSVLIFCLVYLKKKDKPLLCVDTHAGAGIYDLTKASDAPNAVNREWENGAGRLRTAAGQAGCPPMIADYVKFHDCRYYSGTPEIMARMIGKGDRLVCFELHPGEYEKLKVSMEEHGRLNVELRREDGLAGLKSLLPPPSRRGLILIDPSWEERSEYEDVPRAVTEGLRRFPQGTFIIWYPLLALPREKTVPLRETLFGLFPGKRCRAELFTGAGGGSGESKTGGGNSPRRMYGSGLVIYNPPWTLRAALEETLPYLAKVFGGNWHLDWKE